MESDKWEAATITDDPSETWGVRKRGQRRCHLVVIPQRSFFGIGRNALGSKATAELIARLLNDYQDVVTGRTKITRSRCFKGKTDLRQFLDEHGFEDAIVRNIYGVGLTVSFEKEGVTIHSNDRNTWHSEGDENAIGRRYMSLYRLLKDSNAFVC